MAQTYNVLVYGTLKQGMGNHRVLAQGGAVLRGKARTEDFFFMWDIGGFPLIKPLADCANTQAQIERYAGRVTGEVYTVTTDTLRHLDYLESNGRLYERQMVQLRGSIGVTAAWCYIWLGAQRGSRVPASQQRALTWTPAKEMAA
jgi:gamma-glutamylcyclotransferase (GGCT)/AIG2-like uncharacterized protein YtfP